MNKKEKDRILFIATSPLYQEKGSFLRMYSILKMLSEFYATDLINHSHAMKFYLDIVNIYRPPKYFKPMLSIGKPTAAKLVLDFLIWVKAIRLSLSN